MLWSSSLWPLKAVRDAKTAYEMDTEKQNKTKWIIQVEAQRFFMVLLPFAGALNAESGFVFSEFKATFSFLTDAIL